MEGGRGGGPCIVANVIWPGKQSQHWVPRQSRKPAVLMTVFREFTSRKDLDFCPLRTSICKALSRVEVWRGGVGAA